MQDALELGRTNLEQLLVKPHDLGREDLRPRLVCERGLLHKNTGRSSFISACIVAIICSNLAVFGKRARAWQPAKSLMAQIHSAKATRESTERPDTVLTQQCRGNSPTKQEPGASQRVFRYRGEAKYDISAISVEY